MKKFMKKFTAVVVAAGIMVSMFPASQVCAKNAWIDGATPEKYTNRVTTSNDLTFAPTVRTNFYAGSIKALIPTSPKSLIDHNTGVDASYYADATSFVYVEENNGYGELAKAVLNNALTQVNGTLVSTIYLNLFKYEGGVYKMVENTVDDIQFMVSIPKSVRANTRDYAMVRINRDGTFSYLFDADTDPITLTFYTNYFAADDLYALIYAPHGAFEPYKPVPVQPIAQ